MFLAPAGYSLDVRKVFHLPIKRSYAPYFSSSFNQSSNLLMVGLPMVVHKDLGTAEWIEHELLFDNRYNAAHVIVRVYLDQELAPGGGGRNNPPEWPTLKKEKNPVFLPGGGRKNPPEWPEGAAWPTITAIPSGGRNNPVEWPERALVESQVLGETILLLPD
ncbi:MAG: hypothetical protein AAF135_00400 [Bacteroidota bacterium]